MLRSILFAFLLLGPQGTDQAPETGGFVFENDETIACTAVKSQSRTGTCWSFSTISFLEAELIRTGKGDHDLSEMFVVRHTYPAKARNYVARGGEATFGPGGLAGDVLRVLREVGAAPEEVYDGLLPGRSRHDHGELHAVLRGFVDVVAKRREGSLTPVWNEAVGGVLDAYLGDVPGEFTYAGRRFTPRDFEDWLDLDLDRYVEFTSYTDHPFYERIALEIPDNWAGNLYYNVPLDEMMAIVERAIELGYSVGWDGDTSERSFAHRKGVATLPAKAWADRTSAERKSICDAPEPETVVTQELRQHLFETHATTDDHLMHVVGTANDRNGTRYYLTKNSFGTANSRYDGFLYQSESYFRAKTISVLVHEDVVPDAIAEKIGLRRDR